MVAIMIRDLVIITRQKGLALATAVYVLSLAGFVFAWADGMPIAPGSNVYEQARIVQWGLLIVSLSWIGMRCPPADRGDRLVMLSAISARRPSSIIAGKFLALSATLGLVTLAGLPVAVIAQQMAAAPASMLVRDQAALFGLPILAAAMALAWTAVVEAPITGWLGATGSVSVVVAAAWGWRPDVTDVGTAAALIGLCVAVLLAGWSDRSARYLQERTT